MKLALMPGETVPRSELKELGFFAMQMFWGHGPDGDKDDPTAEAIDALLEEDTHLGTPSPGLSLAQESPVTTLTQPFLPSLDLDLPNQSRRPSS